MSTSSLGVSSLNSCVVCHSSSSLELIFQSTCKFCFGLLIFATYRESSNLFHIYDFEISSLLILDGGIIHRSSFDFAALRGRRFSILENIQIRKIASPHHELLILLLQLLFDRLLIKFDFLVTRCTIRWFIGRSLIVNFI